MAGESSVYGIDYSIWIRVEHIVEDAKAFHDWDHLDGEDFDILHEYEKMIREKVSEVDELIKAWDKQIFSARENGWPILYVLTLTATKDKLDDLRRTLSNVILPKIVSAEKKWLGARIDPKEPLKPAEPN